MSTNYSKQLYEQQYGFSIWKERDALMERLRCTKQNAFTQVLADSYADLIPDTPIFACKFSPKEGHEQSLALANEDGKLAIHDSETNDRYGVNAHNNAIFDLAWMFDQLKIVTASGDHTSKLYDVGNGDIKEVRVFCGHTRSVKTVNFRKNDPSVFASGGRDGNIILWDTRTDQNSLVGKADRTILNSHLSKDYTPSKTKKKSNTPVPLAVKSVTGLVFQDENTLVSCGAGDGVIKVWDLRKNYVNYKKEALPKSVIPYTGNTSKNGFSSLVMDESGIKLYANCLDNTIYCYNMSTYNTQPVMKYTGHQNNTFYIKASLCKDGRYLVSGSSDENAYIWNTKRCKPIVKLAGHSAEVTCVAWCLKNDCLVTCSDDTTHKIWTVGPEDLPEDWDVSGRGKAEILPLEKSDPKRINKRLMTETVDQKSAKKFIVQCERCKNNTSSLRFCNSCNVTPSKRKCADDESAAKENKRLHVEFGPKCLFGSQKRLLETDELADVLDNDNNKEQSVDLNPCLKKLKLDDNKSELNENEQRLRSTVLQSPTINLPNYIVDGTAPHINYSPPKKKSQDWLTKIRIERNLRQEMLDRTTGPASPKTSKLELTPKSSKKHSYNSPKSPLLRFFKVTNSNSNKCENTVCSSKAHNCNFLKYPTQLSQ